MSTVFVVVLYLHTIANLNSSVREIYEPGSSITE